MKVHIIRLMKRIFRNLNAAAMVTTATALGTMAASTTAMAQGTMLNFEVDGTCQSTLFADGIYYTAGTTTVRQFYNIDPTKAGQGYTVGTAYEIITTPTETITTSAQPVGLGLHTYTGGNALMNVGGIASPYGMEAQFQAVAQDISPGFVLNSASSTAAFQQYFNYINAFGNSSTAYASAIATDNGPIFGNLHITMMPDPSTVLLTNAVLSAGLFRLSFTSVAGHTHAVRYRADAHSGLWQTLTNIVGDGSFKTVQTPATNAACFFQVITQ